MRLAASRGGAGAPLMVLLHGLGATRQVWTPFLARATDHWSGRWIAFDLPGHGESGPASDYSVVSQAAVVGAAIQEAQPDAQLIVLGHSFGGVLAMVLASGVYGVQPQLAAGLGVKVAWTPDDVAALAARAAAPPRLWTTREQAAERFLKAAGLAERVAVDSPIAQSGIVSERSGSWRLAMDPRAYGLGQPPIAAAVDAARCPVRLASGAQDAMSPLSDLLQFDPGAETLPGLGHNAMVEDAEAVWVWLKGLLGGRRRVGAA